MLGEPDDQAALDVLVVAAPDWRNGLRHGASGHFGASVGRVFETAVGNQIAFLRHQLRGGGDG